MKIKTEELIDILKAVRPGLANKEIIEQSTSFIFQDKMLITYNNEIMISHPIDLDIEGAIPAQRFYDLLGKVKDKEIDISLKGGSLKLKGKKFKASLRVEESIRVPLNEVKLPGQHEWYKVGEDFIAAIRLCLFSVGIDMTVPVRTCLKFTESTIQSTDGFRLTQYEFEKVLPISDPILVPASSAKQLVKYPVKKYGITDGWIHFKTKGNVTFSCRVMNGEFPDFKEILRMRGDNLVFPSDTIEMLRRASVLTDVEVTNERMVDIILDNKKITIIGKGNSGEFEETSDLRYNGDKVEFQINAEFLIEIINKLRRAELSSGVDRLKFSGDNFIHVVALTKE